MRNPPNPFLIDPHMDEHDILAVAKRLRDELNNLASVCDGKEIEVLATMLRESSPGLDNLCDTMDEAFTAETNTDAVPYIHPDRVRQNFLTTAHGSQFYPGDPRVEELDFRDIAHALALKCRWTGHTNRFYSVGRHSIVVAHVAQHLARKRLEGMTSVAPTRRMSDEEIALRIEMGDAANNRHAYSDAVERAEALEEMDFANWCFLYGLLHDAHEFVLPDAARPIKHWFPALKWMSRNIDECVYSKLGIGMPDGEMEDIVKEADNLALTVGAETFFDPAASLGIQLTPSMEIRELINEINNNDRSVTVAGQVIGWKQTKREFLGFLTKAMGWCGVGISDEMIKTS